MKKLYERSDIELIEFGSMIATDILDDSGNEKTKGEEQPIEGQN